jgi:Ca2+-binding EF-hand superfamily protein
LAAFRKQFLEPAKEFPEFSRNDIDAFILAFKEFDLDGNGSIDAHELGLAFEIMGQGVHPDQLKKIIAEVDSDGNGTIEWVEFLAVRIESKPNFIRDQV